MRYAETFTDFLRFEAEEAGIKIGEKRGEIKTIKNLYRQKILTKKQYEIRMKRLTKELEEITEAYS